MATEDQAILAKISQLAGQINRKKSSHASDQQTLCTPQAPTSSYSRNRPQPLYRHAANCSRDYAHPSTAWRPHRGGYAPRGHRGGRPGPLHRHRTLVLNGNGTSGSESAQTPQSFENGSLEHKPSWVTKQDRHLQLINTNIFEKDSQTRTRAMEETRKQKLIQRDAREKMKFTKHLQRLVVNNYGANESHAHAASTPASYEINVQGIQFRVAKNGSKLVKAPGERPPTVIDHSSGEVFTQGPSLFCLGDHNAAKATPKTAIIGGVRFYRSKSGNMYRSGIIKAHRYGRLPPRVASTLSAPHDTDHSDVRRNGVVKKINEPCKAFTMTGSSFPFQNATATALGRKTEARVEFQLTTTFLGSCSKGPRCRYVHDPLKVAVCNQFLSKGSCPNAESCDLSHDLIPERTPTCLHFTRGNCSNANCRYTHVKVSPSAPVCRQFAIYGFCEKGAGCEDRHVHECPDFSNTGTCATKGCKLPHRYKASVMRTNPPREDVPGEDNSSDLSSDEDEESNDGDIDSDDLNEEYFGEDGKPDVDAMQQDYVQLS